MALSFAISLLAGGASALMPHGSGSTFLFCASLFVPIVVNLVGLSRVLESDWYHAVLSVILLPMLLLLWAVGLGVIREFHLHALATSALVLGLAPLYLAARPTHHVSVRLAEQH